MEIKRIAIVGGGTAGWMAANHLGLALCQTPGLEITLIESKDVPVIGVGEGTVPRIKDTLQKFGISEAELLGKCDATFKQGIKFANWMSPEAQPRGFYYHPFSPPYPFGYDFTPHWLNSSRSLDFDRLSDFYCISEQKRAPKQISSPPYQGLVDYAYHFNAAKFSELLAENAKKKFSVKHIFETVEAVHRDSEGFIASLSYVSGREESFDFYIDCSGFSSLLFGGSLGVPFLDKSEQIKSDSALVYRRPSNEEEEISPFTFATAHRAGWMWDIPLTNRSGLGFVYASDFMSENEAVEAFSLQLGEHVDAGDLRKVPMRIGYRKKFWEKNCVALGLAQGFVEPLEATSILVTDFSADLIAKNFPVDIHSMQVAANHCNRVVEYTWERVIDFVQLHYYLSDRRDSDFWVENTEKASLSDVLSERLMLWRSTPPKRTDFFSRFDIFGPENYLFVLYGMNFDTRSRPVASQDEKKFSEIAVKVQSRSREMSESLLSHRKWLTELKKAMNNAG